MNIFILDGFKMSTIVNTHNYLEEVLRLPDYYGHNLDALADCLSEFDDKTTIVIMNVEQIYKNLNEYGGRLLSIFEELSNEKNSYHLIKQN